MRTSFSFVLFAAFLAAASCGDNTVELPTGSPVATATATAASGSTPASGEPSIQMNAPGQGATAYPGNVTVSVIVTGFSLTDKLGKANEKGEGHVIFYLDVDELPTDPDVPAFVDDESKYIATQEISHTWTIDDAGDHRLSAQLVNNDHTPLDPPVTATLTMKVIDQ